MLKQKVFITFTAIFLVMVSAFPVWADFFATEWGPTSSLYRINPSTLSVTPVGATGQSQMIGLCTDTDSTIYAVSEAFPSQLWKLSPTTGSATSVGSLGFNLQEGDMTISPTTGDMYVADGSGDKLYKVNKATGATTLVGPFGAIGRDVSGLQFIGTTLYGLALRDSDPDALVTVDPLTGAATLVGTTGTNFGVIAAMGRDPVSGIVYIGGPTTGFGNDNTLYSLNLSTGAATLVGNLPGLNYSLSGFSVSGNPPILTTPEPSSLLLFVSALFGLTGLAGVRRFRQ